MNKPYNIILLFVLLTNIMMGFLLFQQNSLLTEYKQKITSLEVRLEDLDDAIEEQMIPSLRELQHKDNWEVRDVFIKNGKRILGVMPDPGLRAGKVFGYIFSFSEPFETFTGKELAIYAYHKETGDRIIAVAPKIITELSTGYPSLERFTATFEIPIGGLWRYEVEIDGEYYADVVLQIND
ncbi:hypothetical protein ACFSCX_15605 [Bacillus salitolerans]|uniref:Uncharacterized protein n=1 Tax=Bacillus salitolerans TaxID=1437434 RepID=A0ABW4LSB5_9BACI